MINKPIVQIKHVKWREGRPRFEPGPRLRDKGHKGHNLQHPDGTWFSYEETAAFSKHLTAELSGYSSPAQSVGEGGPKGRMRALAPVETAQTLGTICEAFFDLPALQGVTVEDGKIIAQPLARASVVSYAKNHSDVKKACARLAMGKPFNLLDVPITHINNTRVQMILTDVHRHSGPATAIHVRAFLNAVWKRMKLPRAALTGLDSIPTPLGKVNPREPEEVWHMIETADAHNRPEIGDMVLLAVMTGLRQTDRLQLTMLSARDDYITCTPSKTARKTGKTIRIPMVGYLATRITAARERRNSFAVQHRELIIDEHYIGGNQHRQFNFSAPWRPDHYRHVFAEIRELAAATMPSIAAMTDQSLRDTAQTWLDRLEIDPAVIRNFSGHVQGTSKLQKDHYIESNQRRIDKAVEALDRYLISHRPQEGSVVRGQ